VQVSSLKGDQVSAQGFNPGLGNSRRCAPKGHQNPARHIGSKSFVCVSSFSRHFQGACLRGGHPGLKPWAELLCPFRFRGGDIVRSLHRKFTLARAYAMCFLNVPGRGASRHVNGDPQQSKGCDSGLTSASASMNNKAHPQWLSPASSASVSPNSPKAV
jgi:hypothetical protein